jgi:type IV fimbrial biogenesis protein FimT
VPLIAIQTPLIGLSNTCIRARLTLQRMKEAQPIFSGIKRQRGFTLIEVMMTIAILAILVSIATPTFTSVIRNSQISSQTNELATTLALARSEATKRRQPVAVCTGPSGACSGSTDWSRGWFAYVVADGTVLHQSSNAPAGMTITAEDGAANALAAIVYQGNGQIPTQVTLTVRKSGCGIKEQRQLNINVMGQSRLAKQDCP